MSFIELVAQAPPGMQAQGPETPQQKTQWYRIENAAEETADVYVYDSIGGWSGVAPEDFINDLKGVTARKINLRINSPGGSVFDGIAIANAIRSHPAHVTTHVDGLAASIASVIALAGNRVVMQPSSQMMIHDAAGGCFGNSTEMMEMAALLDKQSDNIAAAYSARAGGTSAEWRDVMRAETWYLADEAVKAGLADEAVPLPKSDDQQAAAAARAARPILNTWDLSVFRYAGREAAPGPVNAVTEPPPVAPEPITVDFKLDGAEFEKLWLEMARKTIDARALDPGVFDAASPSHSTAVKEGTWDAGANEGKLPSPMPIATAKKFYAAYDSDGVEDGEITKQHGHLPHHFVSADGSPGAASLAGVRNALARLNQTQGISAADKAAAKAHLQKHLAAGGGSSEDDTTDSGDAHVHAHREPEMVNVMRQFDEGDIVAVICEPHEPGHTKGVVHCVNGNAYGIIFETGDDDTAPGEPYYWYVDDELQFVAEGPDGGGADEDEDAYVEPEAPAAAPMPGSSHPYGIPNAESDDWDSLVAGLMSDDPQPSSADEILHNLFKEVS
jgi:ATP-dependent protease ClpP protease subunit